MHVWTLLRYGDESPLRAFDRFPRIHRSASPGHARRAGTPELNDLSRRNEVIARKTDATEAEVRQGLEDSFSDVRSRASNPFYGCVSSHFTSSRYSTPRALNSANRSLKSWFIAFGPVPR